MIVQLGVIDMDSWIHTADFQQEKHPSCVRRVAFNKLQFYGTLGRRPTLLLFV